MKHLMWVCVLLNLAGCVSIKVAGSKFKTSDRVDYTAPNSNYEKFSVENADKAWIDRKSGNSISFQSVCNESSDPKLSMILTNAVTGIDQVKVTNRRTFPYNKRTALRADVSGKVDGVDVLVDFVIFKKNNCSYVLNYVALKENHHKGRRGFERFIKGFNAK